MSQNYAFLMIKLSQYIKQYWDKRRVNLIRFHGKYYTTKSHSCDSFNSKSTCNYIHVLYYYFE